MVALKLPGREFKGLLNFVRERILKHVYGINLLCTALKKSALVQFSKNNDTTYFQVKVNIQIPISKNFILRFEAG